MSSLFERYGFWGLVRLTRDVIHTRLFFRQARLVRRPVYIRGRSSIDLGSALTTGIGVRIDAFNERPGVVLHIGDNVQMNDHVHIAAIEDVTIGSGTLIASRVFISDHNHGDFDTADALSGADTPPGQRPLKAKPVRIGNNVWIGEQVCILPGVTIGTGAVIGAGAVVTRDIPAGCVAAGNPARVLRRFDATTQRWSRA